MNVKLSQIIGQPVIDISTSVKDFMKSKIDKMEVDAAFMAVNLTSIIQ
jgi:ornithine decarboxylase